MSNKNHDTLFKKTLQEKENAIDYLKNQLSKDILKEIELDSLEIAKDSFIDQNHNEIHSDILFKVMFRGKLGYIYLLLEHKSYPDRLTAFQLLKYMVGIWDLHLKQSKAKEPMLPIILPMVLYHGETEWKYGNDLLSIQVSVDALEKYQVNFSYLLHDLSKYRDEEIKGKVINKIFLLLFKYIHSDALEEKLYFVRA
jgi:predicted transposase/invertase (TIGR01784 family)